MKKPFLLTLALLLGACGDKPAEVARSGSNPNRDPAALSPAGTQDDPAHVADLDRFIGRTGIWTEGYVTRSAEAEPPRDHLLLADTPEASAMPTVRVVLEEKTEIQARLNIADHPDLAGEKVLVKGDISLIEGELRIVNVTDQSGGREPVVDPDPLPGPGPEPAEPPAAGDVDPDRLYGYAAGTTGGEDAAADHIRHFDDAATFDAWLRQRETTRETAPAKVYLSGTFTQEQSGGNSNPRFDIAHTSNISICGVNGFVMQHVGLRLDEASNIIIRNIRIRLPESANGVTGLSMQQSHDIWIDHCTFESADPAVGSENGACDITSQSYNVTVSWCHFIRTPKACTAGASNTQTSDTQITATFHHNYFDRSASHHPCVRFGRAHVCNNLYNQVTTYGAGSAYGAMVLVESNLFDGVRLPTDICTFPSTLGVSNLQGNVAGYLYECDNVFLNKPADAAEPYPLVNVEYLAYDGARRAIPYTYEDFRPSYDYVVDEAAALATIIPSAAGAGKLPGYDAAPIDAQP